MASVSQLNPLWPVLLPPCIRLKLSEILVIVARTMFWEASIWLQDFARYAYQHKVVRICAKAVFQKGFCGKTCLLRSINFSHFFLGYPWSCGFYIQQRSNTPALPLGCLAIAISRPLHFSAGWGSSYIRLWINLGKDKNTWHVAGAASQVNSSQCHTSIQNSLFSRLIVIVRCSGWAPLSF